VYLYTIQGWCGIVGVEGTIIGLCRSVPGCLLAYDKGRPTWAAVSLYVVVFGEHKSIITLSHPDTPLTTIHALAA